MNEDDDIREIFRRAFEQQRGETQTPRQQTQSQPPNTPPRPPRPRAPQLPSNWWRNRWLWVAGIFLTLIFSFSWIIRTYTDWLWFRNVGYDALWLTEWGAQLITFAAFFAFALIFLLLNARFASKGAVATSDGFQPANFAGFKWLLRFGSAFLAFGFAGTAASQSNNLLRYLYRVGTSTADPIFNKPHSFYFFELPVYQFFRAWSLPLLFIAALGVVGIYVLHNIEPLRQGQWRPQNINPLRRHLSILGGFAALLVAAGHWLSRYSLLYGQNGFVTGVGYTDFNVTARVQLILAVVMGLIALMLFANIRRLLLRPIIFLVGAWFLITLVGAGIIPAIYQQYVVEPNELSREERFIQYNIDSTRLAFGLDQIEARDFGDVNQLTAQDLEENEASLKNIRLWDYRVLPKNYQRLQSLRDYYQFGDIDIDRYDINGETRQVMLGAREINEQLLPNDSWINRKLEYTHGYGIVMNPVDRFSVDGQPEFWVSDIPVLSEYPEFELTKPQIYYGERMDSIVYAGSQREEIDYLGGSGDVLRSRYEGEGGVRANNILRRLAMAVRFGDINLLLSSDITPETRIMYYRPIQERIDMITPFLTIDRDPYLVVDNGRLVWIVDAYTTSNLYPYSEPTNGGVNYIRNVAKITVDAYDGTVNYYRTDANDPIVDTYARIFPNLFKPMSAMPTGLQAHLRYPETLFLLQSQKYLKYHMDDTNAFYSQGDLWEIPSEKMSGNSTQQMEPYYVMFRLPGEEETEYLLIQPYTPAGRPNMVAWIAARNDAPHRGELIVYEWSDQSVFGPENIEARIDQDPEISGQLSLWDQSGSNVIRGNLIVVPINNSFLYVEPLYLEASAGDTALPELKRVIVASGTDLVMRNTLAEALAALLGAPVEDIADGIDVPLPVLDGDTSVNGLIVSANRYFEAAQEAQRNGDWTVYGEQLALLEQVLKQLSESAQP